MKVIADTGAIIALLDEDDKHHAEVAKVADLYDLIIPASILPELDYMVTKYLGEIVMRSFLDELIEGIFTYLSLDIDDIQRTLEIMARYSDIPIGFVDASLVALAERHHLKQILTLDRRHFNIIRSERIDYLELLP